MLANLRMQRLQDDLQHTATELEDAYRGLCGHARYLRHSVHGREAKAMESHAKSLQSSACTLRQIAQAITP
ncbi:hypothetical protein [Pseudomonas guariconensis]|uniref:hypothetical protein n=1 Tax=Pseudomonas guariconensis TaxID=1288410 RepID=UPI0018ABFA31|nr:hypothetical protein [Pseudomonas guariconensis]MBF8756312.1 hypothetical protein [Pseudomonas guariconensis]